MRHGLLSVISVRSKVFTRFHFRISCHQPHVPMAYGDRLHDIIASQIPSIPVTGSKCKTSTSSEIQALLSHLIIGSQSPGPSAPLHTGRVILATPGVCPLCS